MTESEQVLAVELGVYGCWLLKHVRKIGPNNEAAQKIYRAYEMWSIRSNDHSAAAVLMNEIDAFIESQNYEPLKATYDEAMKDLEEVYFIRNGYMV